MDQPIQSLRDRREVNRVPSSGVVPSASIFEVGALVRGSQGVACRSCGLRIDGVNVGKCGIGPKIATGK